MPRIPCFTRCKLADVAGEWVTDLDFVLSLGFVYKVTVIVAVSSVPLYAIKAIQKRFKPAAYAKVAGF